MFLFAKEYPVCTGNSNFVRNEETGKQKLILFASSVDKTAKEYSVCTDNSIFVRNEETERFPVVKRIERQFDFEYITVGRTTQCCLQGTKIPYNTLYL